VEQAEADGAQKIVLEVRESNLPARALYEKAGFVESGSRSGYYRDPEENAICYGLQLRPTANKG
jgi:ribosomal-protein-alanine N-acetyltransferase